jgi:hypothetical protein
MTDWPALDRFLATDPRVVGCEQALRILHVCVEMVLEGAPGSAARRYPGAAARLRACRPCDDDFRGATLRGRNHLMSGSYPAALPPVNHTAPVPRRRQ